MSRRYSIVTPVYDPPADVLRQTIDSVRAQTHRNWELVLVDDKSPSAHVLEVLREAASGDERITVVERDANGGIVAASNDGLDVANGDFVGLLDHDDVLTPEALAMVDLYADRHPEMDYCYSDEDLLDPEGHAVAPFYKPDWSPERLRSQNYLGHFSVFRAELLEEIGGFRPGFDGSLDYDIFLRATEAAREVVHIPYVLYHWRQLPTSVASGDTSVKPYAYVAGRSALQAHCDRLGIDAEVEMADHLGNYHIRRRPRADATVSVIVPTSGATGRVWGIERRFVVDAVQSVVASTSRDVEFVVVHDPSTPGTTLDAIRRAAGSAPVVMYAEAGADAAMINLGVARASGDFVLLIDESIEVQTEEFLDPLVALADDPAVGAVGCKTYFADGRVNDAGHVYHGRPQPIMSGRASYEVGPGGLLVVQREVSGLSSAAMLLRRAVFEQVGGMNPSLPRSYADIDLSLKIRHCGLARIWTAQVELYHFVNRWIDVDAECDEGRVLLDRWGQQLAFDPYSNPNLQPGRGDWVEAGLR